MSFHKKGYVWTKQGMLNLVRSGPRLLKLVRVGFRLLNLVRDGRCLLNLIQAGRLNIGSCGSGTALVCNGPGRGRYRPTCGDNIVRCGRGAGQGRSFAPSAGLGVALCSPQRPCLCLRHIFLRLGCLKRGSPWLHGRQWPRISLPPKRGPKPPFHF